MRTLNEVLDRLGKEDVDTLVDILNIDSETLLERFDDYVAERLEELEEEYFDE